MVKTYIFGTPKGFNFYENENDLKGYFQSFYTGRREGCRMVVHRQGNGVTYYNYIRYGLLDSGGRSGGFFGMTLAIDGNMYCRGFSTLIEWFEYIFDKLAKESGLFITDDGGGPTKYSVSSFMERDSDVEWLKGTLPMIFSPDTQRNLALFPYDASFQEGGVGRIAKIRLDDSVNDDVILQKFKRFNIVSISTSYRPVDGEGLDFYMLEKRKGEINELLLPYVAREPFEKDRTFLKGLLDEAAKNYEDIGTYIAGLDADENEEKERFLTLSSNYQNLYGLIQGIIGKIAPPEEKGRLCQACGRELPAVNFRSDESGVCLECEGKEARKLCQSCRRERRLRDFSTADSNVCKECENKLTECVKCGRKKPRTEFPNGSNICNECHSHSGRGPANKNNLLFYIAIGLVAIIGALYVILPKESAKQTSPVESAQNDPQKGDEAVKFVDESGNVDYNALAEQWSENTVIPEDQKESIRRDIQKKCSESYYKLLTAKGYITKHFEGELNSLGLGTLPDSLFLSLFGEETDMALFKENAVNLNEWFKGKGTIDDANKALARISPYLDEDTKKEVQRKISKKTNQITQKKKQDKTPTGQHKFSGPI